jgi:hypothetical protein
MNATHIQTDRHESKFVAADNLDSARTAFLASKYKITEFALDIAVTTTDDQRDLMNDQLTAGLTIFASQLHECTLYKFDLNSRQGTNFHNDLVC